MASNTPASDSTLSRQQKAALTQKKLYGKDFHKKIGSQAGKKSTSRPLRDVPGLASRAGNARWEKYRQMTDEEKQEYRDQIRAKRRATKEAKLAKQKKG